MMTLSEDAVKALFVNAKTQADYLVGLYKMVLPQWDDIVQISGWPSVNGWTWKAIGRMAIEWDATHKVNAMAGGLWLNNGFSTAHGDGLDDWEVPLEGVTITLKGDAA